MLRCSRRIVGSLVGSPTFVDVSRPQIRYLFIGFGVFFFLMIGACCRNRRCGLSTKTTHLLVDTSLQQRSGLSISTSFFCRVTTNVHSGCCATFHTVGSILCCSCAGMHTCFDRSGFKKCDRVFCDFYSTSRLKLTHRC